MYTLQIDVQSAAPLDGTTPLNINAPGVTVDKVANRTIIVTLDGALVPAFGRIDPGQVIEDQIPTLAGKPLLLIGFSATSSAGTYIGVGSSISRVTPRQGTQEAVQELANLGAAGVQGMVFGQPEIFPLGHQIAITTLPAGPTRLIFVLKELADDDVAALGCCDPGGGGVTPLRAILPVFDTVTDPSGPGLAYKVAVGDDLGSIIILGENLTGITTVDVSTDVNVAGNGSPPPVVGALVVTDTSIIVPLDASASLFAGDIWGIILRDAAGNVYGAPSPLKIFAGL